MLLDINCDMGESTNLWGYNLEQDLELLNWVGSVNLACGYHAGDATAMNELVRKSIEKGVNIGAHPSYPDRANFGRTSFDISPADLYNITIHQLGGLSAFISLYGGKMHHVKPHGALYNWLAAAPSGAGSFLQAVKDFDASLLIYGLSGSAFLGLAAEMGLSVRHEVFADRRYHSNGTLVNRSNPKALIEDVEESFLQFKSFSKNEPILSLEGIPLQLLADTVCVHSDSPIALSILKNIQNIDL
jgi:UPF0271 protein